MIIIRDCAKLYIQINSILDFFYDTSSIIIAAIDINKWIPKEYIYEFKEIAHLTKTIQDAPNSYYISYEGIVIFYCCFYQIYTTKSYKVLNFLKYINNVLKNNPKFFKPKEIMQMLTEKLQIITSKVSFTFPINKNATIEIIYSQQDNEIWIWVSDLLKHLQVNAIEFFVSKKNRKFLYNFEFYESDNDNNRFYKILLYILLKKQLDNVKDIYAEIQKFDIMNAVIDEIENNNNDKTQPLKLLLNSTSIDADFEINSDPINHLYLNSEGLFQLTPYQLLPIMNDLWDRIQYFCMNTLNVEIRNKNLIMQNGNNLIMQNELHLFIIRCINDSNVFYLRIIDLLKYFFPYKNENQLYEKFKVLVRPNNIYTFDSLIPYVNNIGFIQFYYNLYNLYPQLQAKILHFIDVYNEDNQFFKLLYPDNLTKLIRNYHQLNTFVIKNDIIIIFCAYLNEIWISENILKYTNTSTTTTADIITQLQLQLAYELNSTNNDETFKRLFNEITVQSYRNVFINIKLLMPSEIVDSIYEVINKNQILDLSVN